MTSPLVLQILFVLVFGALIVKLFGQIYRGDISSSRGGFWVAIWSLGLVFVLVPALSERLAKFLGVTRGTDAVLYTALALLSVLVYRLFQLSDIKDREISRLTEELALLRWDLENKADESALTAEHAPAELLESTSSEAT